MIDRLLRSFVRFCLWLRYRIRVRGLDEIARRGAKGVVFLPNHPALIDPIIMLSVLHKRFRPVALADRDQIDRFFIRWLAKRVNARAIPDPAKYGLSARKEVRQALIECAEVLERGGNLLLYPSGRAYRQHLEDVGGNSAAHTILQAVPGARAVLVRIRGLWGSTFSWASGRPPDVARGVRKGILRLLLSGLFFSPKREVTIEFHEPDDLPRSADKSALNRYMERFYNENAPHNTHVPYTIWERPGARELPEPAPRRTRGSVEKVPDATRRTVVEQLRQMAGVASVGEQDRLAHDLGLDSLARAELIVWLEKEFGFPQGDVDSIQTVADVMLAASGEAAPSSSAAELRPIPARWFQEREGNLRIGPPTGQTITEAFLAQARRGPDKAIVADQVSGVKTYRDVVLGVMVLKGQIEKLPGERVGIMFPASVAADVLYLSALFAGKTPVMVNWTAGPRNVAHALDMTCVTHVLTAGALVERIESQGIDLAPVKGRFLYLEKLVGGISRGRKLRAWLASRTGWSCLWKAKVPETAAVLFTSGSEALPKAVPLTHGNILTNIRDAIGVLTVRDSDRLMSFLPPFHSFGLTVGMLVPLCCGVPAAHYPNPTDGAGLGRHVEAYRTTLIVGTPTFLNGIVRASTEAQLATLRLAVTGAERCTERVHSALVARCPRMVVLEGYGVTECSPMISVSREESPRLFTIGKVLPSVEHAVVDVRTGQAAGKGEPGVLLVRGPSVFSGYLNYEGPPPFVEFAGKRWYRTGDLVSEDADGVLTFRGRLKRFVKLGGEMVSLPAIEAVLEAAYAEEGDEGPILAVEATPDEEHPELVLFTARDIDRETVNRRIRDAGLSALHNIRRVVRLERIPILGTGKTDYRTLKEFLVPGREGPVGS